MSASELQQEGVAEAPGIFDGKAFFISAKVPSRSHIISTVESNGGKVVKVEKQAHYRIADNARKDNPPGFLTWQFIDVSVRTGYLADEEDYLITLPGKESRPVGSKQPARTTRRAFTEEEDYLLAVFVLEKEHRNEAVFGNKIYQELAKKYPSHTWQSWRDRWVKNVRNRAESLVGTGASVQNANGQSGIYGGNAGATGARAATAGTGPLMSGAVTAPLPGFQTQKAHAPSTPAVRKRPARNPSREKGGLGRDEHVVAETSPDDMSIDDSSLAGSVAAQRKPELRRRSLRKGGQRDTADASGETKPGWKNDSVAAFPNKRKGPPYSREEYVLMLKYVDNRKEGENDDSMAIFRRLVEENPALTRSASCYKGQYQRNRKHIRENYGETSADSSASNREVHMRDGDDSEPEVQEQRGPQQNEKKQDAQEQVERNELYCDLRTLRAVQGLPPAPIMHTIGDRTVDIWDIWTAVQKQRTQLPLYDWETVSETLGVDWMVNKKATTQLKQVWDGYLAKVHELRPQLEQRLEAGEESDDERSMGAFETGAESKESIAFSDASPSRGQKRNREQRLSSGAGNSSILEPSKRLRQDGQEAVVRPPAKVAALSRVPSRSSAKSRSTSDQQLRVESVQGQACTDGTARAAEWVRRMPSTVPPPPSPQLVLSPPALRRGMPARSMAAGAPQPSAARMQPSGRPTTSTSAATKGPPQVSPPPSTDKVRTTIEGFVALGYPQKVVVEALKATTLDASQVVHVMDSLRAGNGIPRDRAGVWTASDDAMLRHCVAVKANAAKHSREEQARARASREMMVDKHGEEVVKARTKYLANWRG